MGHGVQAARIAHVNETTLRRTGAAVAALVPAAVLLAWWPTSLAPFAPYKALALTALVAIVAAAAALDSPNAVPRLLVFAWGAVAAVFVLAALAGTDPWRSLRGTYPRYESLAVLLTATALMWLLPAVLNRRTFARMSEITFGSTIACGVYALLQAAGMDPLHVVPGGRAWGTVGNPILLGTAMALLACYPLAVTLTRRGTRWMRILAPAAASAAGAACVASQSRGAWLGLAVGAAVTVGLSWRLIDRRRALATVGAVLLATLVMLAVPGARAMLSGRIASVGAQSSSSSARLLKYRVGVGLVAARPVLGWGWDTVSEVYPSRLPVGWMRQDPEGRTTDRLHNEWLDIAFGTGIVGLAAVVVLVCTGFATGLRALGAGGTPRALAAGLIGATSAYVVASMTAFPALATWPLLWATVGLLAALGLQSADRAPLSESNRGGALLPSRTVAAFSLALAATATLGAGWAVQDIAADQAVYAASTTPGKTQAFAYGIAAARFGNDAYVQIAAAQGLLGLGKTVNDVGVLSEAERMARRAVALRPGDPAYTATLGDVLLALGLRGKRDRLQGARDTYARALRQAPNDPSILDNAGVAEFARETTAGYVLASGDWLKSYSIYPADPETPFDLALAYERLGNKTDARRWIAIAASLAPDRQDIVAAKKRLAR